MSRERPQTLTARPTSPHRDSAVPMDKLLALENLLQSMMEAPWPALDVRLIVDAQPARGAWNMAVDEALLESAAAGGETTFRLYRWSDPTISLGYFQRETPEIETGGRFQDLACVRRLSGGGAILHHHELTYSCCIPPTHPLAGEPARLYDELHAEICKTLDDFGVQVAPRGVHEGDDKPFLCFARGDRRDLVYEGFKVVGSAQRRRGGAVLQHGSILLRRSPFLPEIPGLLDLARTEIDVPRLAQRLTRNCARALGTIHREGKLTATELARAERLDQEKYGGEIPDGETC